MELTAIGKLFFGGLIAWIANDAKLHFKIKGTPEQMQALAKAAFASKNFQKALKEPGMTIEKIMEKLNEKNKTAEEFKEIVGASWPL